VLLFGYENEKEGKINHLSVRVIEGDLVGDQITVKNGGEPLFHGRMYAFNGFDNKVKNFH
jgi:hypothetical protein